MQIVCPQCSHADSDGLGLLSEEELHALKCGGCGALFYCFIHDCEACLHESVFSWSGAPSDAALALLHCECCAKQVGPQRLNHDAGFDKHILTRATARAPLGVGVISGVVQ